MGKTAAPASHPARPDFVTLEALPGPSSARCAATSSTRLSAMQFKQRIGLIVVVAVVAVVTLPVVAGRQVRKQRSKAAA